MSEHEIDPICKNIYYKHKDALDAIEKHSEREPDGENKLEITNTEKLTLLESFLLHNADLEKLETMLLEFNIFEILKSTATEIRHSNVLAWILNPDANHGLHDRFLRLFLQKLFVANKDKIRGGITLFDIAVFDFDDIEIRTEWSRIDILIISEKNKFVVAIENKTKTSKTQTSEHSDQLNRYRSIVSSEFSNLTPIFVFLTPDKSIPSDTDNWIISDYSVIHSILTQLLDSRKDLLTTDVYNFLNQYRTALGRYVLPESDIRRLCKKIYKIHKEAIDLINEYKPDMELEVSEIIKKALSEENDQLTLIASSKTKLHNRFYSNKLDKVIPKLGTWQHNIPQILLFEFENCDKQLILRLYIGPGDEPTRIKLHMISKKTPRLFNRSHHELRPNWLSIYQKEFLNELEYDKNDVTDLEIIISNRFTQFMKDDLPQIEEAFSHEFMVGSK